VSNHGRVGGFIITCVHLTGITLQHFSAYPLSGRQAAAACKGRAAWILSALRSCPACRAPVMGTVQDVGVFEVLSPVLRGKRPGGAEHMRRPGLNL